MVICCNTPSSSPACDALSKACCCSEGTTAEVADGVTGALDGMMEGVMEEGFIIRLDGTGVELMEDALAIMVDCNRMSSVKRKQAMWVCPPLAASMRMVELSYR